MFFFARGRPGPMAAAISQSTAQDGGALDYAAPGMKEDREVVVVAVGKGWPLQRVPEEMKGDRSIVLAAGSPEPTKMDSSPSCAGQNM